MTERTAEEIKTAAFKLRTEKRMTIRQIADELGISLGQAGEMLKGIKPDGTEQITTDKKTPQFIPMLISKEYVAKLYAMAMDEGFDDVNDWIKNKLLPWYSAKRDLEWKLRLKIEPRTFILAFESIMLDSIELKELRDQIQRGRQPPTVTAPSMNKPPEAKSA